MSLRSRLDGVIPGRRHGDPPAEVLAASGLSRGAVLASTQGADGSWLLGTRGLLALVGPAADEQGAQGRTADVLRWEEIEDAGWDQESRHIEVREAGEFGRPRRTWSMAVGELEPRALLQLLRERVTASIVVQRKAEVHGKRGVVVACRRSPLGGPMRWTVAFERGVDPDEPESLAAAEALLTALRRELGELADS